MPAQASKFGENKQLYWYYIYYIDLGQTVGCPGKKYIKIPLHSSTAYMIYKDFKVREGLT